MSDRKAWACVGLTAIVLAYMMLFMRGGFAEWKPEYAQASPQVQEWYKNQKINPEARARLNVGWTSCCDESDHFKTRFRMLSDGSKYGVETYEYLAGDTWKVISPDIIKRAPTPDGQPVLFIHKTTGKELCFIIDEGGT